MTTPIYHFGERRQAMRSARSNLRRAELLAEDIADEIVLNESNGWTNLVSTLERVEAVRHNLNLATENLEISTYAYGEGLGTILDVLQAQLSWLQIYNNAIAAQYDYALAIAAYQYIIGESRDR
jgi:outer membrane protein TolC